MMKKHTGFTVIELLIVVGLIGILVGVLLPSMTGVTTSARAAKCLAHLHNLASACHAVAMSTGCYPLAGSKEHSTISVHKDESNIRSDAPGWISWDSQNAYKSKPKSHMSNLSWFLSTYEPTAEKRIYMLTNGTIWKAMSGNAASYVCPHHLKCVSNKKVTPVWSYVMNSSFGWDQSEGSESLFGSSDAVVFDDVKRMDRILLFAELPFDSKNTAQNCSYSTSFGIGLDPTLQYTKNEVIGFNHKDGKKWYAHVCFADGHTEKLELPKGAGESQIQELTKWLCEGTDFAYNGKKYEEPK